MPMLPSKALLFWMLALSVSATGCSGRQARQEAEAAAAAATIAAATIPPGVPVQPPKPLTMDELAAQNSMLNARVKDLEGELLRLTGDQTGIARAGVLPGQSRGVGESPEPSAALSDPERGFVLDSASKLFQRGMILFRAGQAAEAVVAFSQFVENHPDHPLAGSALYYTGAAYMEQKEYKQAVDSFSRGITSYDRNPRISHTLRMLAEAHDALSQPEEAKRARSLLSNLFPGSPANQGVTAAPAEPPATETVGTGVAEPEGQKPLDSPPEAKH